MSFYVSEDLKGRITEDELIKDQPGQKIAMQELESSAKLGLNVTTGEELFFVNVQKIKKLSDNTLKVNANFSLSRIEQIFFKKLSLEEIVIGDTKKKIIKYDLTEVKKSFDSFKAKLLIHI